jgi:L-lactate dehydrogenase complex protein LldG
MSARNEILQSIRKGLKHQTTNAPNENYIDNLAEHIIPARVELSIAKLIELFISKAEDVSATLMRCMNKDLAAAVTLYFENELPDKIKVAPGLSKLNWGDLAVEFGTCVDADKVSITEAIAGVAETGTLMCASSPETPTLLNFLPETSIIIIDKMQIMKTYEQAWQKVSQRSPLPRAINFITGPSRTGDIEQQLLLGIHGPKKLHIIIVERDLHDLKHN